MSSKSSPGIQLLNVSSFQPNKNVDPNINFLSQIGRGLSQGGFMPGKTSEGIDLSFLNDLVSLNPEATRQAVDLASRDVTRYRDVAQQDMISQLEANNQLTSSTAVNRLSTLNEQFSADISDIATSFYLADVERSLANTASLFELGLNTTGQATNLGLNEQGQRNEFALQNYQNLVAQTLAAQPRKQGGGLLGGSIGSALGLGAGLALAPATGGMSLLASGALGTGVGGAFGAGVGASLFPSSGVDPGLGFISGGMSLAGAGAGMFQPTNKFSSSSYTTGSGNQI